MDSTLEDKCYGEPFVAAFTLKGKSDPFYVINYHSRKHNDKPEEEIIHFIDCLQRLESERILIAGDFNLTEKHAVWKPFYSRGFKSALNDAPTTLKAKCKTGDYLHYAIDNIFFTPQIQMLRSGRVDFINHCGNLERGREISDHLVVFLEFGVGGGTVNLIEVHTKITILKKVRFK